MFYLSLSTIKKHMREPRLFWTKTAVGLQGVNVSWRDSNILELKMDILTLLSIRLNPVVPEYTFQMA